MKGWRAFSCGFTWAGLGGGTWPRDSDDEKDSPMREDLDWKTYRARVTEKENFVKSEMLGNVKLLVALLKNKTKML